MTRWRLAIAVMAVALLTGVGFFLASAGADRRAALVSTQTRLAELQGQRLDPRDVDTMKKALAAPHDPQTGVLAASETEAATRLEAFIRSVAEDHKAEMQSISLAADTANSKLPVVRGNLHLVINDENIGSFVKTLEAGPPAVFLERLRIFYKPSAEGDSEPLMIELTTSILVYRDMPAAGSSTP
jgi:hypothetical protein